MSSLTQRKLKELETRVEYFKLPSNISSPISQSLNTPNNTSTTSEPSVRNPYLFEGALSICRTSQAIQNGTTPIKKFIGNQPKLKESKRLIFYLKQKWHQKSENIVIFLHDFEKEIRATANPL